MNWKKRSKSKIYKKYIYVRFIFRIFLNKNKNEMDEIDSKKVRVFKPPKLWALKAIPFSTADPLTPFF